MLPTVMAAVLYMLKIFNVYKYKVCPGAAMGCIPAVFEYNVC